MNAAAIIPEWRGSLQPPRWHRLLREAFTDLADLLAYLELEPAQLDLPERPLEFGLRLPRGYAALMRKGDPHDPLLRQVLPSTAAIASVATTPMGSPAPRPDSGRACSRPCGATRQSQR